ERAAIAVAALVHRRRPELLDQRAGLARDLDPIEIAIARAAGRGGKVIADALDVVILHNGRGGPVGYLPQAGWREGREPIVDVPALAPPSVGELHGAFRAVLMDRRRHAAVLRDNGIGRAVDLAVVAGVFRRHSSGTTELREPDPALRLLRLIADVALGDDAADGVARRMTGAEEAVADAQSLDVERPE